MCVCVCVCPSSPPPDPTHTVGLSSRIPPHTPPPPFPHPYLQASARPTPGKNYPLKSAPKCQGTKNGAFGKPCLCPRDTRHFRHFVVSRGLSSKALVLLNVPQKGVRKRGVGHFFFLFRSPFGNHFVTFLTFFGHFFAPIPFCLPPFAAGFLLVRTQIRHIFAPFSSKTPFFLGGTKARFTKSTVLGARTCHSPSRP